jgi:uncharacterized protein (TIGR00725 family)
MISGRPGQEVPVQESPAYVAVVGPGDEATHQDREVAGRVGRLLAERGAVLVCGGLGGVMEAAARGARDGGGLSIGLLPGRDRGAANAALSVALATGLGELRNGLVVAASDAVIAVGGSWGTQSEIALAMRMGKPVVTVNGWAVEVPAGSPARPLAFAASADEAISTIYDALTAADA